MLASKKIKCRQLLRQIRRLFSFSGIRHKINQCINSELNQADSVSIMKKILITGANGFLGQHLSIFLANAGYQVISTGKGEKRLAADNICYESVELTNSAEVQLLLRKHSPNVIIHNAALSKPDECENNREYCLQVNVESTRYLLASANPRFIYISTDFIFGENGPHAENARPGPLNFYGQSKLIAEQLVKQTRKTAAIVKPAFIYGRAWDGMRPTFLYWVKNNLEQKKQIKVDRKSVV